MSSIDHKNFDLSCPLPQSGSAERITLAEGEGGWLSRRFIQQELLSRFGNPVLNTLGDAAVVTPTRGRLAVSTDSFTVSPLDFPGGDIGTLAVCGTVNDLAVSGARPKWLTLALLIEEGFLRGHLQKLLNSLQKMAMSCGVSVIAGDTKVVPRGALDGLFLNTTGVGEIVTQGEKGPHTFQPGDVLIVTGPIGRHGAAILCAREGFDFQPAPTSDCAPLIEPMLAVWEAPLPVRAARDATRGGVAAVLQEWSSASELGITIDGQVVPVTSDVRAVCELLGLDPIHMACEGTALLVVAKEAVASVLTLLRSFSICSQACEIGHITAARTSPVRILRSAGREVPLDEPAGSPLPRIC